MLLTFKEKFEINPLISVSPLQQFKIDDISLDFGSGETGPQYPFSITSTTYQYIYDMNQSTEYNLQ